MEKVVKKAKHFILPHYYKYIPFLSNEKYQSVWEFKIFFPFRHGRTQDFLPPRFHEVGGTSMDFYADSGIPYVYTIELPDLGQFGFQLPESNIEEVHSFCFICNWSNMQLVFRFRTFHTVA